MAFLRKNVLNKTASVSANTRKKSDRFFGGVVSVADDKRDFGYINAYLLESGKAKYKEFASDNLVPYYWPCRLEKAQEKAKKAKLGIWAVK